LNGWPADYESAALPTELRRHTVGRRHAPRRTTDPSTSRPARACGGPAKAGHDMAKNEGPPPTAAPTKNGRAAW